MTTPHETLFSLCRRFGEDEARAWAHREMRRAMKRSVRARVRPWEPTTTEGGETAASEEDKHDVLQADR